MAVNQSTIARVYNWLIGFVAWPEPCALCGSALAPAELVCGYCRAVFTSPGKHLCQCGLDSALAPPAPDRPEPCGRCLTRPPPFDAVWPALYYEPPLDQLIQQYKHQGRLERERLLLRLWLEELARRPPPKPDLVVPLPCHWRRHWRRGFSQAERLAAELGRALALPVHALLVRRRATPAQQGLSRAARERNLAGAFHCQRSLTGLHVALVDDVMTTGSTARTAARALREAGAARVDIWVLARTPPGRT